MSENRNEGGGDFFDSHCTVHVFTYLHIVACVLCNRYCSVVTHNAHDTQSCCRHWFTRCSIHVSVCLDVVPVLWILTTHSNRAGAL